ncbi:hypothetical protein NPIL_46701 [Nephila pilipes]|uniref:Uncharacterized protein n=1 Tax=Nephila pilipes TaxID=299642 RepID=A0A8X6PNW1_NEPPI|nr:hypothetical protein NPIL_46701 [Nephila pilipes]
MELFGIMCHRWGRIGDYRFISMFMGKLKICMRMALLFGMQNNLLQQNILESCIYSLLYQVSNRHGHPYISAVVKNADHDTFLSICYEKDVPTIILILFQYVYINCKFLIKEDVDDPPPPMFGTKLFLIIVYALLGLCVCIIGGVMVFQ